MKLLFYILFFLVFGVIAGSFLKQDSGQVIITLSEYSIQTSLSFVVVLLLVTFFVVYHLLVSVSGLLSISKNYRRWKKTRNLSKSEYFLTQGYLALIEGNWGKAEKLLCKGVNYSRLPMINYVGAARAAQKLGALDRRDSYLRQAYAEDSASEYAVGLIRAELQLNQDQTEQAFATLQHIDMDRPGQNQVKLMMLEASSELNDWERSLAILRELEKKGAMPVEKLRAKQLQAYAHIINSAGESGGVDALKKVWQSIPNKLKKEFYLLEVYVSARLNFQDTTDCELMLRKVIRRNPDSALVRLYGLVHGENPAKQLSCMEHLIKQHPGNYNMLLTMGRLYNRAELWGKARSSFEKNLELEPTTEAYYELATLFELQGDKENANLNFQKGLAFAAKPAPVIALNLPSEHLHLPKIRID